MNPNDRRSLKRIFFWGGLACFLSLLLTLGGGAWMYHLMFNRPPGSMAVSYHLNGGPISSVIVYGEEKKWEGPFVQLDRSGAIVRKEGDVGEKFASTGYYEAGVKVRELSDEEVWDFLRRKRLLPRVGGR